MKRKFVLRIVVVLAVVLIIRTVFLHKIIINIGSIEKGMSQDFIKNKQICKGIKIPVKNFVAGGTEYIWCLGLVYNQQVSYNVDYTNDENSETVIVDKYIRDNIKIIATNDPVLGGQWYVVSTIIDPKQNSGSVTYEDGHIQSSASFKYLLEGNSIIVVNFNVIE